MKADGESTSWWLGVLSRFAGRRRAYVGTYGPLLLILGTALGVGLSGVADVADLTRDPMAVAGGRAWYGCLSNLGVLIWCATSAVCFFAASLLSRVDEREYRGFLLASGAVTLVLLVDDLFMVHERFLGGLLPHSEHLIVLAYLVMVGAFLVRYHRLLLSSVDGFLVVAILAFGVSLMADFLSERVVVPMIYLWEDGAKLVGIVSWGVFFALLAHDRVIQVPPPPSARDTL